MLVQPLPSAFKRQGSVSGELLVQLS